MKKLFFIVVAMFASGVASAEQPAHQRTHAKMVAIQCEQMARTHKPAITSEEQLKAFVGRCRSMHASR